MVMSAAQLEARRKGGLVRAQKLTPEQRREIALKGVVARGIEPLSWIRERINKAEKEGLLSEECSTSKYYGLI